MVAFERKRKCIYDNSNEKFNILKNLKSEPNLKNLSYQTLEILYERGYRTTDDIEKFLYSTIYDLHDSRLLKDSEKAVKILSNAIKNKLHIVLFSDYDSDGIFSAVIGMKGLRNAGANIDYYTNNRFVDGYGICVEGVNKLVKKYPDTKVILTTDNGIVAYEGIKRAKELGITVIVTDHHEPGETLPIADAIVDPKRHDCQYPFKGLCGAGVIFKLLLLLYYEMDLDLDYVYDMCDFVAVATVGDVVPIVDENRILVKEGIKRIKQEHREVFKLLREKTQPTKINSETFGYIYVPMMNALGRIDGSVDKAIELFLSDDINFMKETIDYIYDVNEHRKKLTDEQCTIAENLLENKGLKEAIVLYHPDFHEGIVGLIAGRLKEKYNRPTVILSEHDGVLKGSARSIPEFHLFNSFKVIKDTIVGFGGHAMAAGLSVSKSSLDDFENALIDLAKNTLTEYDYVFKYYIDGVVDCNKVDLTIMDDIEILEPYGEGFRKPLLGLKNFVCTKQPFYMGQNKEHIKLVSDNISAISWNGAERYIKLGSPKSIKAIGLPSINVYNNNVILQFMIEGTEFVKIA